MKDNYRLTCANVKKIYSKVGAAILQMGLTFFMSNIIIVTFVVVTISKIGTQFPEMKGGFVLENAFVIFMLTGQIGVFIGRSSLLWVKF